MGFYALCWPVTTILLASMGRVTTSHLPCLRHCPLPAYTALSSYKLALPPACLFPAEERRFLGGAVVMRREADGHVLLQGAPLLHIE